MTDPSATGNVATLGGETVEPTTNISTGHHDRVRFIRAAAIGGGFATLLFFWLVTRGTFNVFEWQRVSEFYDQQAHSLLHGHFAVSSDYLGIEAFTVGGSSNIYQGPIPAVLRIPIIMLFGHSLDGRLTQLSMLIGFMVAIVFAVRLHWQVRRTLRRDASMSTTEAFLVGLLTFAIAGGSTLLFEGSRAWVYHEALIWGAAFAIAAIDSMLAFTRRPSLLRLLWTTLFATCCVMSRASVGMGPIVGLGLLFVGSLVVAISRHWPGRLWRFLLWLAPSAPNGDDRESVSPPETTDVLQSSGSALATETTVVTPATTRTISPLWLLAATAAPAVIYAIVNYIKFERLFSIPFWGQRFSEIDPARQEFLRANGGTMFGLKFSPTTALHYLRPDAIKFIGHFPFIDFPRFPGTVIGNTVFDLIDRSSSVPTAMPLLTVLSIVGLFAVFRPRAWRSPNRSAPLRVPMLAAGAAAATVIPFGYIANRYLTDFIPFLAIAAAVGLQASMPWLVGVAHRRWARVAVGGIIVLALFGTWVNVGLSLNYQRLWSYNLDPPIVANYLGLQNDLGGIGPVERVASGAQLPNGIGRSGALVVVGDCEAMYLSDGLPLNVVKRSPWNAVEQTRSAGHLDLDVTFTDEPIGTRVPIVAFENSPAILVAEYVEGGRIMFEFSDPTEKLVVRGLPRKISVGKSYHLDVRADPNVDLMVVRMDDMVMLDAFFDYDGTDYVIGRNMGTPGVVTRFPGTISERPTEAPLCRKLIGESNQ